MNIHYQQAEKQSHVFFYIFVTLALLSAIMVLLNVSARAEIHITSPAWSGQGAALENKSMPVAIPAPVPPAEQLQVSMPVPSSTPSPLPQAVAVPVPDLP